MQRDREFQDLMEVAQQQRKVHKEMQVLEKEVEKRDSDIQQLQKQLKEAEHILVGPVPSRLNRHHLSTEGTRRRRGNVNLGTQLFWNCCQHGSSST